MGSKTVQYNKQCTVYIQPIMGSKTGQYNKQCTVYIQPIMGSKTGQYNKLIIPLMEINVTS